MFDFCATVTVGVSFERCSSQQSDLYVLDDYCLKYMGNCNHKPDSLTYFCAKYKSKFFTLIVVYLINLNIYVSYFLMKQHEKVLENLHEIQRGILTMRDGEGYP